VTGPAVPVPAWADLLIVDAHVRTLDPRRPVASAVAVAGGEIVDVGDLDDLRRWRGARTEVVDLGGATLTPGLVDGHTHPVLGASTTRGVDLSACTDLDALRRVLAATLDAGTVGDAADTGDGWILGWGLDPNVFGPAGVRAAPLESVLARRPALLHLFDGHAALASAEALARAGVDGPRRFASGSHVVCDDGHPTGLLQEVEAVALVASAVPDEATAVRHGRLQRVLTGMVAAGLTGGHVMDTEGDAVAVLAAFDADGRLPLRLRLAPWCQPDLDADGIDAIEAGHGRRGRLWELASVKFFLDGTIDGGTAWLHDADCHGQSTRPYWQDPDDYTRTVRRFAAAGVQTATHAIGDAAVAHALDALAPFAGGAVRHRIEHIETLPDDQVARFASLGVVASMQPTHATDYTRADGTDNWSERLGPERAGRGWRCRDLADAGATLVLGSDWPVAPYDPRLTLAAARHRRPARRPDTPPVGPDQGLSALQALHGYTTGPAAVAADGRSGRVAPGHRADLTAFAADPVTTPADGLPDVEMRLTVVDGVVRHRT
jgi:predicted amidohydrolase YtcJ